MIATLSYILTFEFLLSVAIGAGILKLLLYITYKDKLFDMPDERRVHHIPVPRLGGMAFMPTVMVEISIGLGVIYSTGLLGTEGPGLELLIRLSFLLSAAMLLYVLGILDDLAGVNYKIKFAVQFVAAGMLVFSGLWLNNLYGLFGIGELPMWAGIPLTLLFFLLITNALNMIDGIDGLASGIAIITLVLLAFIYIRERRFLYSTVSVTMLGSVVAFWLFNMFGSPEKRTKLYMGDTGSMTLGLVVCALLISLCTFEGRNGAQTNGKYITIVLSSLAIPILEVPRLFVSRLMAHKSPFKPDNNHIHHLLMRCGLTARKSLALILSLDALVIILTAAMTRILGLTWILFIDVAIYVLILFVITRFVKTDSVPKALYR